jgi:hypothetical protein
MAFGQSPWLAAASTMVVAGLGLWRALHCGGWGSRSPLGAVGRGWISAWWLAALLAQVQLVMILGGMGLW